MMNIFENIDSMLTAISIGVTVISIVCTVSSFCSARKAKSYKEEILKMSDTLSFESLLSRFETESRHFMNSTRKKDWYRGVDVNTIISPFKDVISTMGRYYQYISDINDFSDKVRRLNQIVEFYDRALDLERKEVNNLVFEITQILQREVNRTKSEIIKKQQ